jgi:DNA (cytosine-5)-methyltransferase 1
VSARPRLLDLFCGCGGCSVGYARAGFDVVGVDLVRQHDYPFQFILGDALTVPLDGFDAIAASPPCKARTVARATAVARFPTLFDPHVDLVGEVRDRLVVSGLPYVIENVPGKGEPLRDPITLCGSMFGLPVRRHRLFESNVPMTPPPCDHAGQGPVVGVYGSGGADANRKQRGGGGGIKVSGAEAATALGIDWTTDQRVLSQAIPPAYTEWIGAHLLAAVA